MNDVGGDVIDVVIGVVGWFCVAWLLVHGIILWRTTQFDQRERREWSS